MLDTSRLTPTAQQTVARLQTALPPREWPAVCAWLGTFTPYQLEWLLDWSFFALLLKCRQIGATYTYGAAAVLWGLMGEKTLIVSIGQDEADLVLEMAYKHAQALVAFGSLWARPAYRRRRLALASGGTVRSLPSTSAARGHTGNVVMDEAAYYEQPERMFDAAAGAILHGGRIRVASTPNGVGNWFHRFWTDPRANAGYRKHCVDIEEARPQLATVGLPVDDAKLWAMAQHDPRLFAQLFQCSFIDNVLQYLPTSAIEACTADDTYSYDGLCYAGLDVGRTTDRTELVIIRAAPDGMRWWVLAEARKRTSAEDLDALVAMALGPPYRCERVVVDATGLGAFPAERLQKLHGRSRIEPYTFTLQSKEALATGLYSAFTERLRPIDDSGAPRRGSIRIPRGDGLLRQELCSIKRIVTDAGNVRYEAPQTSEGHGDRAWALALALHACSGPDRRRWVMGPDMQYHAA